MVCRCNQKVQSIIWLTALICLLSVFCTDIAMAEIERSDLESLSVDELLSLQNVINDVLTEKGYVVYSDITHGDKGDNVIKLQERLTELGYYSGKISGRYDGATEKAVKQFQKKNGLDVTGTATQEMQKMIFGVNDTSLVTASPKPTVQITPTPDPSLLGYEEVEYKDCARNPEQYEGKKVKLTGRVIQVLGNKTTGFRIRLATSGYDDVYYVRIGKGILDYNLMESDRIVVYGRMDGSYTYTSLFLTSVTIPSAIAESIVLL